MFLPGQIFENRVLQNINLKDPRTMMLVWDMGYLYGLTPFRSDFIDYMKCDITVNDVTNVNRFIVIRTTLHRFIDINGKYLLFPCISYHLTQTYLRLFSPQTYYQMHGGHYVVKGIKQPRTYQIIGSTSLLIFSGLIYQWFIIYL